MTYLNPYSFLPGELTSPQQVNASVLRKAKRKLLAEFELGDGIAIEVDGVRLDRSTALQLLEQLEDPQQANYHWQIRRDGALHHFLKRPDQGNPRKLPSWNRVDPGYREFLSEQLAAPMDQALHAAIKDEMFERMLACAQKLELLLPLHLEKALESTLRFVLLRIDEIQKWAADLGSVSNWNGTMRRTLDPRMRDFINALPSRYQQLRNRYADALMDLAVAISNEGKNNRKAKKVTDYALELELDESAMQQVNHVHQQLVGFLSGNQVQEESSRGGWSRWIWIFLGIKAIYWLVRLSSS